MAFGHVSFFLKRFIHYFFYLQLSASIVEIIFNFFIPIHICSSISNLLLYKLYFYQLIYMILYQFKITIEKSINAGLKILFRIHKNSLFK